MFKIEVQTRSFGKFGRIPVTGAEAGYASVSNKKYDGDYNIDTKFTQSQLEAGNKRRAIFIP